METDEQFGELVAIVVSVRHRHVTEQWFLERVVIVSDPHGPDRAVRCFPCHDVVQARVTLRTGNGTSGPVNHSLLVMAHSLYRHETMRRFVYLIWCTQGLGLLFLRVSQLVIVTTI